VPVAGGVVGGRAGDAVAGESFSDGEQPGAGKELGEDPRHHGSGRLVEGQAVQAAAVSGLGRVRMRPEIDQDVAVRWAAAEEPAFHLGLGGHGGADPDLDPVPFALGHAAEHRHDQVVGLVVRVDRPADLGYPQRYVVVDEQGEGVAELVAVELSLRLADHHGVEGAVRVFQFGQQGEGLRPALPGDGPGVAGVEVLGDDGAAVGFDEGLGAGQLPGPGGFGVLLVLGGDPALEREPNHAALLSIAVLSI
jgi:hypothetical protein